MKVDDYVNNILRGKTRQERLAMLQLVPSHLREKVRAIVEWKWETRNTGSR